MPRTVIRVFGDHPFLDFNGPDGETRMRRHLSIYRKPVLWMADETGKRLSLGVEHSDPPSSQDSNWALDFGPDRARIGMFALRQGAETYVEGLFSVSRDKVKYPQGLSK